MSLSFPDALAEVVPDSFPELAFTPAPSRKRHAGWTADKQRRFIEVLAVTASVADAAAEVQLDPRSAYRLRDRAGGDDFARAWTAALACSATRLEVVAMDRALHGRVERIYNAEGQLVHERRVPSDDMLKWLLTRLDPLTYGTPFARAAALATGHDPRGAARAALPQALALLGDVAPTDCPVAEAIVTEHRDREELSEGDITGYGAD
jgi:hypothetical protein